MSAARPSARRQRRRLAGDVFSLVVYGIAAAVFYGHSFWIVPWWVFAVIAAMTLGEILRHAWLVPFEEVFPDA